MKNTILPVMFVVVGLVMTNATSTTASASPKKDVGKGVSISLVASLKAANSFPGTQTLWTDSESRVYAAGYDGRLYMITSRPNGRTFSVESVQVSTWPLRSVVGDETYVFTADVYGLVYRYPPGLTGSPTSAQVSVYGIGSMAASAGRLIAGLGQGKIGANSHSLYISELNQGDFALQLYKTSLVPSMQYAYAFEPNVVVRYDVVSGARLGSVSNPLTVLGQQALAATPYVDEEYVILTVPGCCSAGIEMYTTTLQHLQSIPLANANTVTRLRTRRDNLLVAGTESGKIFVYDLTASPITQAATLDLAALTGLTGPEQLEVRALAVDADGRIFAATSRGDIFVLGIKLGIPPTFWHFGAVACGRR